MAKTTSGTTVHNVAMECAGEEAEVGEMHRSLHTRRTVRKTRKSLTIERIRILSSRSPLAKTEIITENRTPERKITIMDSRK